ncbi:carbonic anhydrase, partial [Mycobacterium tuberculosis]|uniref:carbonic anhydrase n=1 Tax=Mycobacterium tuberculosis TaxID=1773 RepID=UPI003C6DD02D
MWLSAAASRLPPAVRACPPWSCPLVAWALRACSAWACWPPRAAPLRPSVGPLVAPVALAAALGVAPVRSFLLRAVPFGPAGRSRAAALVPRLPPALAPALGPLAPRSLSLVAPPLAGRVPPPGAFAAAGPTPPAVLFGCAARRVAAALLFAPGLGALFVVRPAGPVLASAVLGSLASAVPVLPVPLLVVLGPARCGAVPAALAALPAGPLLLPSPSGPPPVRPPGRALLFPRLCPFRGGLPAPAAAPPGCAGGSPL